MLNAVIDISHHNGPSLDFAAAKLDGVVGVIHKASQGTDGRDPMYAINRKKATAAGLLWGAYHFATGADALQQASNFLSAIGDRTGVLMVLDFEPNTTGPTMSLDQARKFVTYIKAQTGVWPGLYSGNLIKQTLGNKPDNILNNCWFWLAQYGPHADVPANWPTWTMWQYTDGAVGEQPHQVNGIGHCDRDRFNGDLAGLHRLWSVPV